MRQACPEEFKATVVACRDVPGVPRVQVTGDVDATNAPALRAVLDDVVASRPQRVEVDLSRVTFFSCAGLRELIRAQHATGERLLVVEAARPARRLLHVLGLEGFFELD